VQRASSDTISSDDGRPAGQGGSFTVAMAFWVLTAVRCVQRASSDAISSDDQQVRKQEEEAPRWHIALRRCR
jgi:hypothetical protein